MVAGVDEKFFELFTDTQVVFSQIHDFLDTFFSRGAAFPQETADTAIRAITFVSHVLEILPRLNEKVVMCKNLKFCWVSVRGQV